MVEVRGTDCIMVELRQNSGGVTDMRNSTGGFSCTQERVGGAKAPNLDTLLLCFALYCLYSSELFRLCVNKESINQSINQALDRPFRLCVNKESIKSIKSLPTVYHPEMQYLGSQVCSCHVQLLVLPEFSNSSTLFRFSWRLLFLIKPRSNLHCTLPSHSPPPGSQHREPVEGNVIPGIFAKFQEFSQNSKSIKTFFRNFKIIKNLFMIKTTKILKEIPRPS